MICIPISTAIGLALAAGFSAGVLISWQFPRRQGIAAIIGFAVAIWWIASFLQLPRV